MRLHRLRLTAFGSFPGTEEVDFDALGEAGLFLIHGPTGAGKTTVLDAVCFALYGRVPGQRDKARTLRCDHAPPDRGPAVVLDFTIRGRRLRITRSPAWMRPKLRGTGLMEEKAKTLLEEHIAGEWAPRSTRSDEAGHLINDLMGMTAEQFCQVVLLPQGDFAQFLRASGDRRAELLERLFSVRFFTDLEKWLADHRAETGRRRQALRDAVVSVTDRMRGASGADLLAVLDQGLDAADEGDEDAAAGTDPADDPLAWSAALLEAAAEMVTATAAERSGAAAALTAARSRLEEGRALAERRRRHAAALARRDELAGAAQERADLRSMLDQAARADRVLPLIRQAGQRAEAADKARRLAGDAVGRALPLVAGDSPRDGSLRDRERERRAEMTRLEQLLPDETRLTTVRADHDTAERRMVELTGLAAEAAARLAVLPGEREQAETRLTQARIAAARRAGLAAERDAAERDLKEIRRREARAADLAAAGAAQEAALAALPTDLTAGDLTAGDLTAGDLTARDRAAADLAEAERSRRDELVKLEERAAEETRLREIDGLLADARREAEAAAEREAAALAGLAESPTVLHETEARLGEARSAAARVPGLRAACDRARERFDAAQARDVLTAELAEAQAARQAAVDEAQQARDALQDVRRARIDGMAAELARELVPGSPCVVCGSGEHPAPAAPADFAPTAEDEQNAQNAFEAARQHREAAETRVAGLEARLDEVAGRAEELSQDEAAGLLTGAESEHTAQREVAAGEPALAAEVLRLAAELEELRGQAEEAGHALTGHRARERELLAERDRLSSRLADALGDDPDVRARRDRIETEVGLITVAVDAVAAAAAARTAYEQALAAAGPQEEGTAVGALEAAREALRAADAEAAEEPGLAEETRRLAAELGEVEERARTAELETAETRTHRDRLAEEERRLATLLDAHRGEDASLAARLDRLAAEVALLHEAAEATAAAEIAERERENALAAARAAAAEAGFATVEEAGDAVRNEADREAMDERLRRFAADEAAVEAQLADPELAAAAAAPDPDVAALEAEHERAERDHETRLSAADRAQGRYGQLAGLAGELGRAHERYLPAAERYRLAQRLAGLAAGTSADNQYRMPLSSYVLGERLGQVVAAANVRLDQMSGGRYLLEHHLGRVAGDRARSGGGMALRVLDGWTGAARDPATLSGGETFVTSLALALGLADVIADEAGGPEMSTLFVDEGFGTLDEETLDDVLDILDGLREGGRAVGIVSHVAELRTRIPAQIRVLKRRSGSILSGPAAR
ncbi:AAA family ATPase [Sphaerimonospora cavernae]|uniref:Nuclease SbcCD subunit C n=1 Tax=Sphaerimonospora cavernae TaxID=1740611 RepID=A0ABV6U4L3_9ACTN